MSVSSDERLVALVEGYFKEITHVHQPYATTHLSSLISDYLSNMALRFCCDLLDARCLKLNSHHQVSSVSALGGTACIDHLIDARDKSFRLTWKVQLNGIAHPSDAYFIGIVSNRFHDFNTTCEDNPKEFVGIKGGVNGTSHALLLGTSCHSCPKRSCLNKEIMRLHYDGMTRTLYFWGSYPHIRNKNLSIRLPDALEPDLTHWYPAVCLKGTKRDSARIVFEI